MVWRVFIFFFLGGAGILGPLFGRMGGFIGRGGEERCGESDFYLFYRAGPCEGLPTRPPS